MNLPGQKEAAALGYTLHSRSGNGSSAHYNKDGLGLTVWANGEAELSFMHSMLTVTTGKFAWPNTNFPLFERQVQQAQAKLTEAY